MEAEKKKSRTAQDLLQDELDSKDQQCRKMKSKITGLQEELDDYETTVETQKTEIKKLEGTVSFVG